MTSGTASQILRAPGRWVVGPTDLSAAYPYGGIEIGKTKAVVVQNLGHAMKIISEGLGEATDILDADNRYVVAFTLRGWDRDALERLKTDNYVEGAVSKQAVFAVPGGNQPGSSTLGRARVMLFVPDDVIHSPAILIYRGVPDWTEGGEIAFQRQEELAFPMAVECFRDTNNKMLAIGRLIDLSLT